MARLNREKLERYLLLVSTTVTSILAAPIIGFTWASIDAVEQELAIPESRLLFRIQYLISIVAFLSVYSVIRQMRGKFLKVAIIGFPTAFLFFLFFAQFATRWLKPLDHHNLTNLFLFTLAVGIEGSSISMMVGKLVTLGILRLSFPETKLP